MLSLVYCHRTFRNGFPFVSHSVHVRFTLALFVLSPDTCLCIARHLPLHRATRGVVSGDVRRSLARHAALHRAMQVVASPDTRRCLGLAPDPLGLFGGPTQLTRSTDLPYSVHRPDEFGRPTWSSRWTDRGTSVDRLRRLGLPSLPLVRGVPVCLQ